VGWYLAEHDTDRQFRKTFNAIDDANEQLDALNAYFQAL
jgi:tRNA-dihydrouridine synthase B